MEMSEWELLANPETDKYVLVQDWYDNLRDRGYTDDEIIKKFNNFLNNPFVKLYNYICANFFDRKWFGWLSAIVRHSCYDDQALNTLIFRIDNFYIVPEHTNLAIRLETVIPTGSFHLSFSLDGYGDYPVLFSFACGLFAVYLSLENFIPAKFLPKHERVTEIAIHGGAFWLQIWHDEDNWYGDRFWWQNICIQLDDLILGKPRYRRTKGELLLGLVHLPERDYSVVIEAYQAIWQRPRWFTKKQTIVEITPDVPIPIPGKGENSWDLDDSTSHSMSVVASTVDEAIAQYTNSIIKRRIKYGGENWIPSACSSRP